MKRILVKSSDISAIGYDEKSQILEIKFHSGGVYEYSEIPKDLHESLIWAPSIGKYYNQNIKGRLPSRKLESVS